MWPTSMAVAMETICGCSLVLVVIIICNQLIGLALRYRNFIDTEVGNHILQLTTIVKMGMAQKL